MINMIFILLRNYEKISSNILFLQKKKREYFKKYYSSHKCYKLMYYYHLKHNKKAIKKFILYC